MRRVTSAGDIGPVRVANRVVRTAHVTNYCEDGRITDRFIAYHRARAEGGVGLTILEGASPHPSSFFHPNTLRLYGDGVVEGYRSLIRAMTPYSMRVFQQIWHGGFNAGPADGSPAWSASALPGPLNPVPAIAMTATNIAELTQAFADAAMRAAEGGLHGVEVHGTHGYLFGQFIASATNLRDDEYGGAFENRTRLLVDVLAAIRQVLPRTMALGVRLGPELAEGGVSIEETRAVVALLEERGLVDFVNFSVSNYNTVHKGVGSMAEPPGYELEWTGGLKAGTRLPVIVTGRIRALDEAEQILAEGKADFVGMTRAHIAEPAIVAKTLAGKTEDVRPCIACNQMCIGGMFGPTGVVQCTVNPLAGKEHLFESSLVRKSPARRKIAVIGAGPAGMQAAYTAALRGHEVTLYEAQPTLGGMARIVGEHAPHMRTFRDIALWLERQVFEAGVDVRTSTYLGAEDVADLDASAVIVATGGLPRTDLRQTNNPGERTVIAPDARILTATDVLVGAKPPGSLALVLDDLGHDEAVALAEFLLDRSFGVAFVTRHPTVAPLLAPALRSVPALERLRCKGAQFYLQAFVQEIARDFAVVRDFPGEATHKIAIDFTVYVGHAEATGAAYITQSPNREVHVIGDAKSQRFLPAAIHEGFAVGAGV